MGDYSLPSFSVLASLSLPLYFRLFLLSFYISSCLFIYMFVFKNLMKKLEEKKVTVFDMGQVLSLSGMPSPQLGSELEKVLLNLDLGNGKDEEVVHFNFSCVVAPPPFRCFSPFAISGEGSSAGWQEGNPTSCCR